MYEDVRTLHECSARLRQKLYDSDDIQFSHFYICERSQKFSQVWCRRAKAQRTPGLTDSFIIVDEILPIQPVVLGFWKVSSRFLGVWRFSIWIDKSCSVKELTIQCIQQLSWFIFVVYSLFPHQSPANFPSANIHHNYLSVVTWRSEKNIERGTTFCYNERDGGGRPQKLVHYSL